MTIQQALALLADCRRRGMFVALEVSDDQVRVVALARRG